MSGSKDFPKRLKDLLPAVWMDGVETMTEEEMKESIISCEQLMDSTEQDMKDDEKLEAAKEVVKDLSSAYKDTQKVQKAKIKYLLHTMKQRGYY